MAGPGLHRHIEGGSAQFLAGCELSTFCLTPSIRITNKVSIKADANTILISWRPSPDYPPTLLKANLRSVGGRVRFCHRATPKQRDQWHATTVAGFYQPENAQAALKWLRGAPEVQGQLLYTVYLTAPKEISDAVLVDIESIAAQTDLDIAWEEPRQGNVTLRLSGVRPEVVVDMKRVLEAIFSGRVAMIRGIGNNMSTPYEVWHDFFASPPGEVWLQHLGREIRCIVSSDKLQQRIRIYDPVNDGMCMRYIEQKLAEKIRELDTSQQRHAIEFDQTAFRALLKSGTLAQAQRRLGEAKVSLDVLTKTMVLHCSLELAYFIADDLSLPLPHAHIPPHFVCPQCGDTTLDIEFSSCKHISCRECFDHQVQVASTDLMGNHAPLVCWHEGCGKPISITDLRRYATGATIDALAKASLIYYTRSNPDIYRNCRKPDCNSVYERNGSYEIFTCPTCLTQTCTLCHAEPHIGWTCAEYDIHLKKNQNNERLLDDYKATAGTKDCPKCSTLIEKIDGCNHIECSGCHGHICWACLKVFAKSEAAYQHMTDAHGGNGMDEGWIDEEESESDEENDPHDDDREYYDEIDESDGWEHPAYW